MQVPGSSSRHGGHAGQGWLQPGGGNSIYVEQATPSPQTQLLQTQVPQKPLMGAPDFFRRIEARNKRVNILKLATVPMC